MFTVRLLPAVNSLIASPATHTGKAGRAWALVESFFADSLADLRFTLTTSDWPITFFQYSDGFLAMHLNLS